MGLYRFGLIILLVAAVYGVTIDHGFVWDDIPVIVNNPLLENLGNLPEFFITEDSIDDSTGYYRPVTYISFALDRALWGVNPAGFHATNVVLHLLVVLLFYTVIVALFNRERLAFVAALILALHPIAGETVNFLAGGRNTLLSACFALLSLRFYLRKRQIPAAICFTVAIFSKEFALLLPMVFLFTDYRVQGLKIRFRCYLLYLIPIACYLTLRSFAVQNANFLSAINVSDVMMAPYLVVRYALNMLFPVQLKILYGVTSSITTNSVCLCIIVIMTGVIIVFRKKVELLFSACWFLLFLLPVLNIIPLHATSLMADRYAYFSLMGFSLFLAALICKMDGRVVTAGFAILCVIYSVIDVKRNTIWRDEVSFFTGMTQDAPENFVGFKNLGTWYYRKREIAPALRYLEVADSKPDIPYKFLTGDAYIFWKENMPDQAEKALLRALDLEPGNPEPYLILMMIHEQQGEASLARTYRGKAKELVHNIDEVLVARTVELCRTGETYVSRRLYADAEVYIWQALRINPGYVPALIDMGRLGAETGNYAKAIQFLNRALVLEPMNAPAHYNLSMVYRMQGRSAEAQAEMIRFEEAEAIARQTVAGPRK